MEPATLDETEEALRKYKLENPTATDAVERTPEEAEESLKWLREKGVMVESVEVNDLPNTLHHHHREAKMILNHDPFHRLGTLTTNPLVVAQDRAKAEAELKALSGLRLGDEGTRGFTYVCIPADDDAPVTGDFYPCLHPSNQRNTSPYSVTSFQNVSLWSMPMRGALATSSRLSWRLSLSRLG